LVVADVLAELEQRSPGLAELLAGRPDREIRAVWVAEDLREVENCPAHALVLLSRSASRDAQGYRLDVTLRRLPEIAGLVLQQEAPRPSLSALALARREDLPLIRLTRSCDLTDLLTTVIRMLDAQLPTLLDHAVRVSRTVDQLGRDISAPELLRRSGAPELFGLTYGERDARLAGIPAVLTDPDGPWLQREPTTTSEDALAELSMWRLAAAITTRAIETERAEQLSMMSAGELVNQLLDEEIQDAAPLLRRAAAMGIRVEAWNQVIVLEFPNLLDVADGDPVTAYHYAQTLGRVAARTASQQEGAWTMAPRAHGVILLRNRAHPDGVAELRRLRAALQTVLDRTVEAFHGVQVLCGVGGPHQGLSGLQASRAEADSALQSARLRGAYDQPVLFDAPGLTRLLVEWYSSHAVRQSVEDLLAPLAALGPTKQKDYTTTLRVYLENNRSVSRTAEQLFVHRNTVTYRIGRILDVLGVDLDDPNQYLAVYLACFAQSMPGRSAGPGAGSR
jgi:sugar diacid utilization regulator